MNVRKCTRCKQPFPRTEEYWQKQSHSADGLDYYCRPCSSERQKEWNLKNLDKYKANIKKQHDKNREKKIQERVALKEKILTHYSTSDTPQCVCCGIVGAVFLTIDHINGGGASHRREEKIKDFYWWLKREGFPEGFQTLCWNCNSAKHLLGTCPHQCIPSMQ